MNLYLILVMFFLFFEYILDLVVNVLNLNCLDENLPQEFVGVYDDEKYKKSQAYTKTNTRFSLISSSVSIMITIPFILFGGFNYVDLFVRDFGFNWIITGILFTVILLFASGIISLPFEIYSVFVIEERFGFNKTTVKTFIVDKIKGIVLGVILGVPVLSLILWFFYRVGNYAWFFLWIVLTALQIIIMFIAPVLIMPLFNKFTPLENNELKDKIEQYLHDQGFKFKGIYQMDGSKRSSKSNAYFTGFGKTRRIVLFDTLLEKHTDEEIVSILAHEIGHYTRGHVIKNMILSILSSGVMLYILSIFLMNPKLFEAFKMENLSIYASLIFFGFLYSPISTIIGIVMNYLSRKYEYQADRYAVKSTKNISYMIDALKKLSVNNLSNLTPHPLMVFLSYSHPPVLQRIKKIRKI